MTGTLSEKVGKMLHVCWYQMGLEKYISEKGLPLPACNNCLPDPSNEACSSYHALPLDFESYESARESILEKRKGLEQRALETSK